MENTLLEYGVLGAGLLAFGGFSLKLITGMIEENKKDKERYYTDTKELQQIHREEIKDIQRMYKEELAEDRKVYIESMDKVVGELDSLKRDVEIIKVNQINCKECVDV